jgi:hypothetical protein
MFQNCRIYETTGGKPLFLAPEGQIAPASGNTFVPRNNIANTITDHIFHLLEDLETPNSRHVAHHFLYNHVRVQTLMLSTRICLPTNYFLSTFTSSDLQLKEGYCIKILIVPSSERICFMEQEKFMGR